MTVGYSCYSDYKPFSIRNADRFNWIRNPTEPQLNLALQKRFRINEPYSLQFRGESFNIANTPIRPGPDTDWHKGTFGTVPLQQQNFSQLVQLAAKFYF